METRNQEIERTKKELAELLGKLQRNIDGVGSLRQLKNDYPNAFKKLRFQILVALNDFKNALFRGYVVPSWDAVPKFQEAYTTYEKRIRKEALPKCDVEKVQALLEEFLLWSIKQGGIFNFRIAYPELYEENAEDINTEDISELPIDDLENIEEGSSVTFSLDNQNVKA